MASTRFKVLHAGPLVSFQDQGRPGNMRFGVSASGPMDRTSFMSANSAIGNSNELTSIEISMGGILLECIEGRITVATAGGNFQIECGSQTISSAAVFTIEKGEKLSIRAGQSGSWCYLAFAGVPDVARWLGKTATYAAARLGGGLLTSGQTFSVLNSQVFEEYEGQIQPFEFQPQDGYLRIVAGPQDQHFSTKAHRVLLTSEFALTDAYDRMGVRLSGPDLNISDSLSIPSEPIIRGSVQVSGDGVPTVLLADHQSTGGYPKIATVISSDLDNFVQLRPRNKIRFKLVEPEYAVKLARTRAIELKSHLALLAKPRGTFAQRLMRENLISGAFASDADSVE